MVVLLPNDLSKKIAALKKARGKDWDKELGKAIDSLLAGDKAVLAAEELLLTPKPRKMSVAAAQTLLKKHDQRKGKMSGSQADKVAAAAIDRSRTK
ncbi:hypothetical protein [uncultured Meiothermus sp.]|jgi:hypothetical protein|uniref:hypothetical protein n=1 Tax=uncultured Meiothermus sp. TaxID=157471 RepID=UPI00261A9F7F|nr:hypothetical protein [uncultured Meiothermus sp.]